MRLRFIRHIGLKKGLATGLQHTSENSMCILSRCTRVASPIDLCERCAKACAIISNGRGHHHSNVGLVGPRTCGDVLSTTTLSRSCVNHAKPFRSPSPRTASRWSGPTNDALIFAVNENSAEIHALRPKAVTSLFMHRNRNSAAHGHRSVKTAT